MTAADLLARLSGRGVTLAERDGAIFATPAGALGPDDRALVRELKAELLAILSPGPALDPRQVAAAEGLQQWGAAGGPEHESRSVAIELPDELGIVHVVPERTGLARVETTWRELAADPLGTVAGVRSVLAAVRELGGRILAGPVARPGA